MFNSIYSLYYLVSKSLKFTVIKPAEKLTHNLIAKRLSERMIYRTVYIFIDIFYWGTVLFYWGLYSVKKALVCVFVVCIILCPVNIVPVPRRAIKATQQNS